MVNAEEILVALRKPVAVVCRSLEVAFANPAFHELMGAASIADGSNLGNLVRSTLPLASALTRAIAKLRAVSWTSESRWALEDGRVFELRVTRTGSDSYLVLFDDVTHHLRLQEIQSRARSYLETVLNHLPVGVIVLDGDFRVTYFNEAQSALFGRLAVERSLFEVIGAPIAECYPVFGDDEWQNALAGIARTHEAASWDKLGYPRGEPAQYLRVSLAPLSRQEEPASGAICITEDVSRTVSLERELLEKERLALIGQVTIALNHEINNPLTAILGCAEALLFTGSLGRGQVSSVETIRDCALEIVGVTRRLREIEGIPLTEYVAGGPLMLDLRAARDVPVAT